MITILRKLFIKNYADESSKEVRTATGILCAIVGVLLNVFLFILKLIAGMLSHSVAVMADAFNNLSDAGSSVVTFIGFRLSRIKPDKQHPFGHGRFEYIAGLIVSFLILNMGFGILSDSVNRMVHPTDMTVTLFTFAVLGVSIIVKLYMAFYNYFLGRRLDSLSMKATAIDSLSDTVMSAAVVISMVIFKYTGLQIDSYCGILIGIGVLVAGYSAAKDTISPLLGQPPKKEFVDSIKKIVLSYPEIIGVHDVLVHDYGPGRRMISLHAEVDEHDNLVAIHDVIDTAEKYLEQELSCNAVIHMDPIATHDKATDELKAAIFDFVTTKIDERITLHDFRLVKGKTHTNVIFDIVLPADLKYSDNGVRTMIQNFLNTFTDTDYFAVITIDKNYL